MTRWQAWLNQKLLELNPECVCTLDSEADRFSAEALPLTPRYSADAHGPCTLALGIDALTGLDAASARQLIHHTRLYVAPRLLLLARADCALDGEAFRALGFMCEVIDAEAGVSIQSYDLAHYKSTPDWLNARFWAHPDRWEP